MGGYLAGRTSFPGRSERTAIQGDAIDGAAGDGHVVGVLGAQRAQTADVRVGNGGRCGESIGARPFHVSSERGCASTAIGHADGRGVPGAAGEGTDRGQAGAGDTRAQAATRENGGAIDAVDLAAGDINVFAGGPAVGGIGPAESLVSGAFKGDTTTVCRGVGGAGNVAQDDVLIVNSKSGAVDRGGGAVDGQITTNRQVAGDGAAADWQVAAAQIRNVTRGQSTEPRCCRTTAGGTSEHVVRGLVIEGGAQRAAGGDRRTRHIKQCRRQTQGDAADGASTEACNCSLHKSSGGDLSAAIAAALGGGCSDGTGQIDVAGEGLVAADGLSGAQRGVSTRAADGDDAGGRSACATSASSVVQNGTAFCKCDFRIGQARGCTATRGALDADGVSHGYCLETALHQGFL